MKSCEKIGTTPLKSTLTLSSEICVARSCWRHHVSLCGQHPNSLGRGRRASLAIASTNRLRFCAPTDELKALSSPTFQGTHGPRPIQRVASTTTGLVFRTGGQLAITTERLRQARVSCRRGSKIDSRPSACCGGSRRLRLSKSLAEIRDERRLARRRSCRRYLREELPDRHGRSAVIALRADQPNRLRPSLAPPCLRFLNDCIEIRLPVSLVGGRGLPGRL